MNHGRYQEVLNQLDDESSFEKENFPKFGESFRYIDSRMSVYGNNENWGLIIESIEVNPQDIGHRRNLNIFFSYGNNLIKPIELNNDHFISITSNGDDGPVFGDYSDTKYDYLLPVVKTIRIRDHLVSMPDINSIYNTKGINSVIKDNIEPENILRVLTPEYREHFFLTEEEKQKEFKELLPKLLQLEEWRHPVSFDDGTREKPSECETFQLIAKVIENCDPSLYRPTEPPNTHWKNWMISDKYL